MRKARASLWLIGATLCTVAVLCVLPITPRRPVRTVEVELGDLPRTLRVEASVDYAGRQAIIAPATGHVERVCVSPGQQVDADALLVAMETGAESVALEALFQGQKLRNEAISAIADAQAWGVPSTDVATLRLSVQSKRMRASREATVEQVYVSEGQAVVAGTPLLLLREPYTELAASLRLQDSARLRLGDGAIATQNGASPTCARLASFDAPTGETQTVRFACDAQTWAAGESVELEILWDVRENVALVPLSAVDADGAVWIAENGQARQMPIDACVRNALSVVVPDALAGKRVILLPDEAGLSEGCWVKEQKP